MFVCLFVGCENLSNSSDSEATYMYEGGIIPRTQMVTGTGYTYSEVNSVKNYLRQITVDDYFIEHDVHIEEIQEFLLEHSSRSETETIINALNNTGNCICYFNINGSPDYVYWVYGQIE